MTRTSKTSAAGAGVDVVFSFDTTGSMYPCLTQCRRHITESVAYLFGEIPGLRVGIMAHGDYCDGPDVLRLHDLSDDCAAIRRFVNAAPATGGGDAPECYELVLHHARELSWRPDVPRALVLIGDDVPHPPSYPDNRRRLDWRQELKALLDAGVQVHAVQALGRAHATAFYEEVARTTGGFRLQLEQFSHVTDTLLAICFRQADRLDTYEARLQTRGAIPPAVQRSLDTLAGRIVSLAPGRSAPPAEAVPAAHSGRRSRPPAWADADLVPVHPSRFQLLEVDDDCSIRDFVEDNDLAFAPGRGFYEFTKPVLVQRRKEVVVQDRVSGAMYSGDAARRALGIPVGAEARVSPPIGSHWRAFIQSTSNNRKLLGGTAFLYEMDAAIA